MAFCFTSPVTPFYFKNNNLNKFSPLVSNKKIVFYSFKIIEFYEHHYDSIKVEHVHFLKRCNFRFI